MPNRGPGDYLALAQEAERAASEAPSDAVKNGFLAIAQEYRMLAAEKLKQMQDARGPKAPF